MYFYFRTLIPFVGFFNIMVTDFPVCILSSTIVSVCILIWGKNSAPGDEVVNSLGACLTEPSPRVRPIMKNINLKISCEEALIMCSDNKLFMLRHKPGTFSCKSKPAFWLRIGYWSYDGFDFQAVSIAFFPLNLLSVSKAILFNFWPFSVFFISPSNSVFRSRSIFRANSLASFTAECELFSFSCFQASCTIQSSDKFKYWKRPIVEFL